MTTVDTDTVAEIHEELANARAVELPHWLKIAASVHYSSLSRSKIYELIDEGEVRSVCLRDKDKVRGVRLISRPSLEAYLTRHEDMKSDPVPGRKGRKSKKEKEAEKV
jgi:hypothetical protein